MARQNHGPLSRAKGKLGGVVYQQYEGMQISREYQPVVKNPQSTQQVNQRAKFKLASQVVAQFADIINTRLAKSSIYTRVRRGSAVRNLTMASKSTPDGAELSALTMQNAINMISMPDIESPTLNTSTAGQVSVVAPTGDIVEVTTVGYNAGGMFEMKSTERYISDGTAKIFQNIGSAQSILMVVALRATTEEGRATISNALESDAKWANAIKRVTNTGDLLISDLAAVNLIPA